MPEKSKRLAIAFISIGASVFILILKWIAFKMTGSSALKSDALESVVNVVAAAFALFAVIYAERPADKEHPYGHGKIEFFSAAFEGGLITLASVLIIYDAINTLISGPELKNMDLGLAINVGAGALNGLLGLFLIRQGRQLNSEAIQADGHHILSDFITTLGIAAGLLLVLFTGWVWLDPAIALLVGLVLAKTGFTLVKKSSNALIDTQDLAQLSLIVNGINICRTSDIIAIHELRIIRSGRHIHVDMHIVVPEFHDIRHAHDLVEEFGSRVMKETGLEGEVHSHIDPCYRRLCRNCKASPCPIRQHAFEKEFAICESDVIKTDLEILGSRI
ncbi:MAG: cation transporter [Bdellovibrio sp.]|nr:cation transporter [Bdellovibrio sp.]